MFPHRGERSYAVGPHGELAIGHAGAITVYRKDKKGPGATPFAYLLHPAGEEELDLISFNQVGAVLARESATGRGLVFGLETVAEIRNPTRFAFHEGIEGVTFTETGRTAVVRHSGDGEAAAYTTIDLNSGVTTQGAAGTPAPKPVSRDRKPPLVANLDVALDPNSNVVIRDARTGIVLALFETSVEEFTRRPEWAMSTDQRWVAVFWEELTRSGEWGLLLLYDVTGRSVLQSLCVRLPKVASERLGPGFAAMLVNHSIACPS